jgi:hypothetical protein
MIRWVACFCISLAACLLYAVSSRALDQSFTVTGVMGASTAQCPSSAPAEAQRAGFTAMVLCNDFTQALPNTAGTGTSLNYWGCAPGQGAQIWFPYSASVGCVGAQSGNHNFVQVTDSTTGGLSMQVTWLRADDVSPNFLGWQQYATDDHSSYTPGVGNYTAFPLAHLTEFTVRDDLSSIVIMNAGNGCWSGGNSDWWDGSHGFSGGGTGTFELDVFENTSALDGGGCGGFNLHDWHSDGSQSGGTVWGNRSGPGNLPTGMNGNQHWFDKFHTYGNLTTTNGTNAIESCGYVDHALVNCVSMPGSPSDWCGQGSGNASINGDQCFGQKIVLVMIVGDDDGQAYGDVHAWLQSIRVWSCPAWNSGTGSVGGKISQSGVNTCYGTVITSENAVKGPQEKMFAGNATDVIDSSSYSDHLKQPRLQLWRKHSSLH